MTEAIDSHRHQITELEKKGIQVSIVAAKDSQTDECSATEHLSLSSPKQTYTKEGETDLFETVKELDACSQIHSPEFKSQSSKSRPRPCEHEDAFTDLTASVTLVPEIPTFDTRQDAEAVKEDWDFEVVPN